MARAPPAACASPTATPGSATTSASAFGFIRMDGPLKAAPVQVRHRLPADGALSPTRTDHGHGSWSHNTVETSCASPSLPSASQVSDRALLDETLAGRCLRWRRPSIDDPLAKPMPPFLASAPPPPVGQEPAGPRSAVLYRARLRDGGLDRRPMTAFGSFCFAASSIYLLNDILDREEDARHPKKTAPTDRVRTPAGARLPGTTLAFTLSARRSGFALGRCPSSTPRSFWIWPGGLPGC